MESEFIAMAVPGTNGDRPYGTLPVLKYGFGILVVKILLAAAGFYRTVEVIRRRTRSTVETTPSDTNTMASVERNVAMAGALFPGRALCLEQSLVLYYALRKRGAAVRLRMGVNPRPFAAHAWVEYRGEPVNDLREHVQPYDPLPDLLP